MEILKTVSSPAPLVCRPPRGPSEWNQSSNKLDGQTAVYLCFLASWKQPCWGPGQHIWRRLLVGFTGLQIVFEGLQKREKNIKFMVNLGGGTTKAYV